MVGNQTGASLHRLRLRSDWAAALASAFAKAELAFRRASVDVDSEAQANR
jgi:hypothetical protein